MFPGEKKHCWRYGSATLPLPLATPSAEPSWKAHHKREKIEYMIDLLKGLYGRHDEIRLEERI